MSDSEEEDIFTTSDFVQNEKEEREKKKKMGTGIIS